MSVSADDPRNGELELLLEDVREAIAEFDGAEKYFARIGSERRGTIAILREDSANIERDLEEHLTKRGYRCQRDGGNIMHVQRDRQQTEL